MGAWSIGVEICGSRIDSLRFARLVRVLRRDFAAFDADCRPPSEWLSVHGVVESRTPEEALASALSTLNDAFDQAAIDMEHVSSIANVTLRHQLRT